MVRILSIVLVCIVPMVSCNRNPAGPSIEKYRPILESVQNDVQSVRGLQFKRPVEFAILSREEYAQYNNNLSSSDDDLFAIELKQLGFIPDTLQNLGETLDTYENGFAAAFYVPGTDSIYIIDGDGYEELEFKYYASHELTHALQEQNFNAFSRYIYPSLTQSKYDSDFFLTQLCLDEGDASLSADLFLISLYPTASREEYVNSYIAEARDTFYLTLNNAEIPRYLEIQSMAPYLLGEYFVNSRQLSSGWSDINILYHTNRIVSTADIITLTPHTAIQSFDYSRIFPLLLKNTTNLRFADDDTYGPVMLMGLLNEYIDEEHCKNAFGWQGDRIAYVLNDNKTYGSFVWTIQFKTTQDANYINNAIVKLLSKKKIAGVLPQQTDSINKVTFSYPMITTTLVQRDSTLFWVENVDDPMGTIDLVSKSTLAKSAQIQTAYPIVPKLDKWKLMRKIFDRQYYRTGYARFKSLN